MKNLLLLSIILIVGCDPSTEPEPEEETVTDIDGNAYQTILIGEQLWMADNLKVTHYNDSTLILTGYSNIKWSELETGAYAVYDDDCNYAPVEDCDDPSNADIYGNLYNWYAVDDSRGICPSGWHVPSDDEFMELEIYLGMSEEDAASAPEDMWDFSNRGTNEASKLAGNANLWTGGMISFGDQSGYLINSPEFGTSGFNGLPAGFRNDYFGGYGGMGASASFWSSSEADSSNAWYRGLYYLDSYVDRNDTGKQTGFSIRCLGD